MNFGIFIWFLFKTSGHLGACTKQIENRAEKLKLEIPIYLLIDFICMYDCTVGSKLKRGAILMKMAT